MKTLLLILGAPLWVPLVIAAVAVVFAIYISLFAIAISIWAISFALALVAPAGIISAVILLTKANTLAAAAIFGGAITSLGFAILVFYLALAISKGVIHLAECTVDKFIPSF